MSDSERKPKRLPMEAIEARLEEARRNPPRNAWKDAHGFRLVSLGAWIEACERAGIDHVPAEPVVTGDIESLLNWEEPDDGQVEEIRRFFSAIENAKQPRTMLRWDMCAPMDVKLHLSRGRPEWSERFLDGFTVDDPRAFELLFEYPGEGVTVWRRPWVQADLVDGYPVEYRVFMLDGRPRGVSSYYPQRDLPDGARVRTDLTEAVNLSCRLSEQLPEGDIVYPPGADRHWPRDSRSFTADFMRLADGRLLFLEGGPPFGAGADPCCFPEDPRAWELAAEFRIDTDAGPVPVALASHRDLTLDDAGDEPGPGV